MNNVDAAWRLIYVVRVWRKLKKMTSMLLSHPGFESVGLNSWVLATATIGLKTKQKKTFTKLFAEGNTPDTRDSGKPQKMEFERCNSSLKSHLFLAASAAKSSH